MSSVASVLDGSKPKSSPAKRKVEITPQVFKKASTPSSSGLQKKYPELLWFQKQLLGAPQVYKKQVLRAPKVYKTIATSSWYSKTSTPSS